MRPDRIASSLPRPPLWRVWAVESALLIVASGVAGLLDPVVGRSLLAGGVLFLLPQAWFGHTAFRHRGAKFAREAVRGLYRAETGKFLLTCAGFATVFVLVRPLHAAAFFGAYIALYVVNTVLLARLRGL